MSLALLWLIRQNLPFFYRAFPPCAFNRLTGRLCPSCGNTRSVAALLHLDILASLRMNITPLLLSVLLALLYLETMLRAYGRRVRILPRKNAFWFFLLGAVLLYYMLRNFL